MVNPPITLCLNGCRLSADPKVCVHTNPGQPRRRPLPTKPVTSRP